MKTDAEKFADGFFGTIECLDGQRYTNDSGDNFIDAAKEAGDASYRDGHGTDTVKIVFSDGSCIVDCGVAWDFGFTDAPDDCYCWPEDGHKGCSLDPQGV